MRTPEEILNTLSTERQKLLDDVLKKIEAAQEARFQGEPIKVPLSFERACPVGAANEPPPRMANAGAGERTSDVSRATSVPFRIVVLIA